MPDHLIDLQDPNREREHQRPTEDLARFILKRYNGDMVEMEDIQFHLDSAVMMPDLPMPFRQSSSSKQGRISGLAVVRACLLYTVQLLVPLGSRFSLSSGPLWATCEKAATSFNGPLRPLHVPQHLYMARAICTVFFHGGPLCYWDIRCCFFWSRSVENMLANLQSPSIIQE